MLDLKQCLTTKQARLLQLQCAPHPRPCNCNLFPCNCNWFPCNCNWFPCNCNWLSGR